MGLLEDFSVYVDGLKRKGMNTAREFVNSPTGLLSQNVAQFSESLPAAPQSVMPGVDNSGLGPQRPSLMDWGMGAATNSSGLLGVVKPSTALKSGVPVNIPQAPEFGVAVANTPGASITPEGLLMRIERRQQPEQGQSESVRGGVFYLPEGSSNAKHYSTGKIGYGGPEKITGETLVRNPLFVKGATGGKAPEAAYDALHGKGAYQEMRKDAQRASGFNGGRNMPGIDAFLNKYAPELAYSGDHIVSKSRAGNQLPYALQEAAVASAVREAGHDAVLGYSKKKTGQPFISELFDVRESHYPDKFGFSRVWDQFEGE